MEAEAEGGGWRTAKNDSSRGIQNDFHSFSASSSLSRSDAYESSSSATINTEAIFPILESLSTVSMEIVYSSLMLCKFA